MGWDDDEILISFPVYLTLRRAKSIDGSMDRSFEWNFNSSSFRFDSSRVDSSLRAII